MQFRDMAGCKSLVVMRSAVDFCLTEIFSFCREAKFGEFRPTLPAQVVCSSPFGVWQWGEMV
jgi:hypothetical protein